MFLKPVTFRLVWAYYIATPLFLIIELLWGISLRVSPFLPTAMRYLYYTCCFGCGAACYLRPRSTPVIALAESTTNVVLIFVGFGTALIKASVTVAETESFPEVLTFKSILGFGVIATIWIISFYHSQELVQKIIRKKTDGDKSAHPGGPQ